MITALLGCERTGDRSAPPVVDAAASGGGAPSLYEEITADAGIEFRHRAGTPRNYEAPQILGAGGALLDYDADGDLDLYLVNGAVPAEGSNGPPPVNRLYRREADGRYLDVTDASGLGDAGYGMGVAVGDIDNDGHPDVYVTNFEADSLYRNRGDGTFANVTAASGARNDEWACSAAFLDYDRDGDLDLFVANYMRYTPGHVCTDDAGRPEYCGPQSLPPVSDVLLRNEGDGTFTDVSVAAGISSAVGRGLGVACEDLDGDGWIDVYVANDGDPNHLWINDRDGTFTESAVVRGAAYNVFASTEASMGVTVGDVDGDGDLDLFMTHLLRESNTLYRNDGAGNFFDATAAAGLASSSMQYTGFGTAFVDLDNDGALDLVAVNGRVKRGGRAMATARGWTASAYAERNLAYRNDGEGRFRDVSDGAGPICSTSEVSRGLIVGDLDDDGGLDLVVTNCLGPARIYRNAVTDRGHWLIVRVIDPVLRRDAYGAVVRVTAGARTLVRTVNPGQSYASSSDPRVHFGLGGAARVDQIVVRWPDGVSTRFDGVDADQVLTLERPARDRVGD